MKLNQLPNCDMSPRTILAQLLELEGEIEAIVIVTLNKEGKFDDFCSSMTNETYVWMLMNLFSRGLRSLAP